MLHIAIYGDQQGLVYLVGIEAELAHHFITEVGLIGIVIVTVDLKGDFVFFE